ncbi:MAG: dimethyl sulfoxide reductase anchor subunit [Gammaproteobacteria bacterium]|nr:dimethyl sulfoxide reductase anchor subunit [Gammaproteobacteria bacterium]
MHPAFSVVFLTTLIGTGQGLFLALFSAQAYTELNLLPSMSDTNFFGMGSAIALAFLVSGLIASVFHLGHPERAWRAASQWRTSWLSREVIALPFMMAMIFVYGVMHLFGLDGVIYSDASGNHFSYSLIVAGSLAMIASFILFICTGMIYTCIKFLQEWATPLTVINYALFGTASGFTAAAAFSAFYNAPEITKFFTVWAIILTVVVLFTRAATLYRNSRIKHKSSMKTAIGVRHNKIEQKAMGMQGGSYNTREYFHGKTATFLKSVKYIFLVLVFPVPVLFLVSGLGSADAGLLITAFVVQFAGLIVERWFFFAQANHPQNLYYQTV